MERVEEGPLGALPAPEGERVPQGPSLAVAATPVAKAVLPGREDLGLELLVVRLRSAEKHRLRQCGPIRRHSARA